MEISWRFIGFISTFAMGNSPNFKKLALIIEYKKLNSLWIHCSELSNRTHLNPEKQILIENSGQVSVSFQRSSCSEAVQLGRDEKRNLRKFYDRRTLWIGDKNPVLQSLLYRWKFHRRPYSIF